MRVHDRVIVSNNPINYSDPSGLFYLVLQAVEATIHWTRNYWNKPVLSIKDINGWTLLDPDKSIYHTMGPGNGGNRKFVSPDGHSEAIFNKKDCLVTDPLNMGSYNFFGDSFLGGVPHFITDVLPYYSLGNSPSDMFSFDRWPTTMNYLNKKIGKYFK